MPYSQSVFAHGKAVVLDITVSEPYNSSILDLKEFSEGAESTSSVREFHLLTVLYSMMFQNKLNHNNSFCVL